MKRAIILLVVAWAFYAAVARAQPYAHILTGRNGNNIATVNGGIIQGNQGGVVFLPASGQNGALTRITPIATATATATFTATATATATKTPTPTPT